MKIGVSMFADKTRVPAPVRPARLAFRHGRLLAIAVLALASACATGPRRPPAGTPDPDKFLFERGTEELTAKDWFTAREYFGSSSTAIRRASTGATPSSASATPT